MENKHWLPSYAIFCHLREKYKAANGNPLHWKVPSLCNLFSLYVPLHALQDWDEQLQLPSEERAPQREPASLASGTAAATPESPSRRRANMLTPKTLRATPVAPASGSSPATPSSPAPPQFIPRRTTPSSLSQDSLHFPRLNKQPSQFRIKRGARFFKFEDLFAVYGPRVGVYYYIQVRVPCIARSFADPFSSVQYLAFRQMLLVKQHANTLGISLMGDIPFLVSGDSADVWQRRDEFRLVRAVDVSSRRPTR